RQRPFGRQRQQVLAAGRIERSANKPLARVRRRAGAYPHARLTLWRRVDERSGWRIDRRRPGADGRRTTRHRRRDDDGRRSHGLWPSLPVHLGQLVEERALVRGVGLCGLAPDPSVWLGIVVRSILPTDYSRLK